MFPYIRQIIKFQCLCLSQTVLSVFEVICGVSTDRRAAAETAVVDKGTVCSVFFVVLFTQENKINILMTEK